MKARGRHDDTDEAIEARLELFRSKKKPIIDFLSNYAQVIDIESSGSIEEVSAKVLELARNN